MSPSEWLVLAAGIASIAWVNWYFFVAGKSSASEAAVVDGVQETRIEVRGGYEPATVKVSAGRAVRLIFDRQETSGCSEEVVLGDFGIRKYLPPFQKTAVEFTPTSPGSFEFTCGMGMLRGNIIVEARESA